MGLTKEQILAKRDVELRRVPVPEWGGDVYVRQLSGAERAAYEDEAAKVEKNGTSSAESRRMALFIVYTLCDENGAALFTAADVDALLSRSFKTLQKLFRVAASLNAITAADLEELGKN